MIRLLLLALVVGCGAPPRPSLEAQRQAVERDPTRAPETLGWWRYLAGDAAGAAAAFDGGEAPLAALGRARIARDALDVRRTLAEAAVAAGGVGLVGAVGRAWAEEAAEQLRDGPRLLAEALGARAAGRRRLSPHAHTVRISFLPWLHLPQLHQRPPRLEGEQVVALGKTWALQAKAPKPDPDGLVLTSWTLPVGPAHLELFVDGPAAIWRGGALVAATSLTHHGPARLRFSTAEAGPLVVVWAARKMPRLWRHAAPLGSADDRPGPAVEGAGLGPDWVRRALAIELALQDHDAESAAARLEDAPQSPAFAMLRARLAEIAPGTPVTAARDAARAAWAEALGFAPARAHLALGELAFRGGDFATAQRHLDATIARAPDAFAAHHTYLRVHLGAGRLGAAAQSLEAARRAAPNPCRLIADRAALADARPGAADDLVQAWMGCDRPFQAAERLLDRLRPGEALEILDGLSEARRGRPRALKLRARALVGVGRLAEARATLSGLKDAGAALTVADLGRALGTHPDLATALRGVVDRFPTAHQALDIATGWPEWSRFAPLIQDTEAAIAAYEAEVPQSGPAVRVLDHSALLFFADGKSLRWVHEVLAVRSRDAAERFGEIGLPADVRTVALYTRKADGRRLFAEDTPEKDSVTLPDLESGDFVVAAYLEPGDNGYLYPSGFLSRRVYFQGVDLPIFHQRFEAYGFGDSAPVAQGLAGAPPPSRVTLHGAPGLRFEARRVRLLPPEGDSVPAGLWLPSVRVGHDVVLADDLAFLRDRALRQRRRTRRFDAWARARAGEGSRRARLVRLARAVREGVDDDAGVAEVDVSEAIASGHGNRALVLSAALEAIGEPHRLLVTRPAVRVPAGPFISVAEFAYPLLDVGGLWLDPGPERAEPGFIPFTLEGGDALVVWPPQSETRPVPLPTTRQVGDGRHVEVRMRWHEDGRLTGEVTDRLWGQEAIVVGHHLSRLEPAQRPRLVERLLVGAVGAAHVDALEDPSRQDPDGPLTLRYRFTATPGDSLPLGLFPVQPGRGYAGLPARKTPLYITLPTHQTVRITLESDRDFAGVPRVGELTEGGFAFSLTAEQEADALVVEARTVIPGGAVAPADYERFADWARAVDEAERVRLEIEPDG